VEARLAGDQLALIATLAVAGNSSGRAEARAICRRALDGLFGSLRVAFLARSEVRWALGEHTRGRRDIGA
jgi:hypothetical protein